MDYDVNDVVTKVRSMRDAGHLELLSAGQAEQVNETLAKAEKDMALVSFQEHQLLLMCADGIYST